MVFQQFLLRKQTLLACLVFFCFSNMGNAQSYAFPGFDSVKNQFLRHYHPPEKGQIVTTFCRKREGWYMYSFDIMKPKEVQNETKFWSALSGQWQPLQYKANITGDINADDAEYFKWPLSSFDEYLAGRLAYWNYPNWSVDMIHDFGSTSSKLSDSLLEGLARAYAHFGQSYIRAQYGNEPLGIDQERLIASDAIPRTRAEKFVEQKKLALFILDRLKKQNPNYQTIVGDVHLKYCSEAIHAYYTLKIEGYPDLAKQFIDLDLYDSSMLNLAKNYLVSVAKNGIIITNGDNETYPMIYLQDKFGYRTDVLVLNFSLMATAWYVNHIRSSLSMSLPQDFYYRSDNGYFKYESIRDKTPPKGFPIADSKIETGAFLQSLANRNFQKWIREHIASNDSDIRYTNKDIYIASSLSKFRAMLSELQIAYATTEMHIKSERTYLYMNDITLIDIIHSNFGKRSIHFCITSGSEAYLGLETSLMLQGMTLKLIPAHKELVNGSYYAFVETDSLFHRWMNLYSGPVSRQDSFYNKPTVQRFAANYINICSVLMTHLGEEGKKNEIIKVYKHFSTLFPQGTYEESCVSFLAIAQILLLYDFKEEGRQLLIATAKATASDYAKATNEEDLQYVFYKKENLIQIADNEGDKTLLDELSSILKRVENK